MMSRRPGYLRPRRPGYLRPPFLSVTVAGLELVVYLFRFGLVGGSVGYVAVVDRLEQ